MTHDTLILPGSLEYAIALTEIPPVPTWRALADKTNGEMALIALPGSEGVLQAVTMARYREYMEDGEFDARQDEIEAQDAQLDGVIIAG